MFTHYPTTGLIFKKEDLRESDQLFAIFTKDFGKLEVMGRAIRKIHSKLRSGADIFYLSEVEFIQGKSYKILTEGRSLEKFSFLREKLTRLKVAHKISQVFDNLVTNQQSDKDLWELLLETFNALNDSSAIFEDWQWEIAYHYFLWNLLSFLGYRIDLHKCSLCQNKLVPDNLSFSQEGAGAGIICFGCLPKVKDSTSIDVDTIKILRIILKKDWSIIKKLKFKETDLSLLEYISNKYLEFVLGQR